RIQCSNNLKQLGLALHNYHDTNGTFPPAYVNKGPYGTTGYSFTHGWAPFLLPFIEQQPLYNLYRWDVPLYDPGNQPVVSRHLKGFQCPAAPEQDRYMTFGPFGLFGTRGACGDYTNTLGVDEVLVRLGWVDPVGDSREPTTFGPVVPGALLPTPTRLTDIMDGSSNTTLL